METKDNPTKYTTKIEDVNESANYTAAVSGLVKARRQALARTGSKIKLAHQFSEGLTSVQNVEPDASGAKVALVSMKDFGEMLKGVYGDGADIILHRMYEMVEPTTDLRLEEPVNMGLVLRFEGGVMVSVDRKLGWVGNWSVEKPTQNSSRRAA